MVRRKRLALVCFLATKCDQARRCNADPKILGKSGKVPKQKDPNEIWDEDDVDETSLLRDADFDQRLRPEYRHQTFDTSRSFSLMLSGRYEILYRQAVKAEDVYMNMCARNASSMDCEQMVIRITLPDTLFSSVNLDVNHKELLVETPK